MDGSMPKSASAEEHEVTRSSYEFIDYFTRMCREELYATDSTKGTNRNQVRITEMIAVS